MFFCFRGRKINDKSIESTSIIFPSPHIFSDVGLPLEHNYEFKSDPFGRGGPSVALCEGWWSINGLFSHGFDTKASSKE